MWAFGCTLYECALGKPPNSDLREPQQLRTRMRRLNKAIELPEREEFSEGLRSLVAYALSPDAKARPAMRDILKHEYLVATEETHPTRSLTEIVNVYYSWLYGGGQRASLFMAGGAVIGRAPGSMTMPAEEWNFSTTAVFEKRISTMLNFPDLSISDMSEGLNLDVNPEGQATPKGKDAAPSSFPLEGFTSHQKANFEARVKRGADLSNLFDQDKPDYQYKTKTDFVPVEQRRVSDLPFRAMAEDRPSSIASNVIDLGDFDSDNYATIAPTKEEAIQLADAATIRAKRGDSKIGTSSESLTAKRTDSAEETNPKDGHEGPPKTGEFVLPPSEPAADRGQGRAEENTDALHAPTSVNSVRKTMDWSFSTAMSEDELETTEGASTSEENNRAKHATMAWSFAGAQAEISTQQETTPQRPVSLLRTVTQPVTSSEIDAVVADLPRPSTATSPMSETASSISITSTDIDPFSLDEDHSFYPVVASALDERGASSFYASEGTTVAPDSVPHVAPTGMPGYGQYLAGPPARIGEPHFPGPKAGNMPYGSTVPKQNKKSISSSSSGETTARATVSIPEIVAPSQAALDANASPELMMETLGSLLGSFGNMLAAAGEAVAGASKERRGRRGGAGGNGHRGQARPTDDEWEDEE